MAVAVDAAGVTWPAVKAVATGGDALPAAPGGEVCGRVTGVGEGVDPAWAGRRVAGIAAGACADVALLAEAVASEVPDDVGAEAAVALVRAGQVALGVLAAGELDEARRVVVTGAAGGVGHLAVQLAAGGGRHVVAATSAPAGAAKERLLRGLGADDVVGYDEPWEPADLVVDGVGGPVQQRGLDALAPFGRLVVYNGVGARLDSNELRVHGRAVIGFAMAHLARHRPETFRRRAAELWERHRGGALRPHVVAFPLADAAAAHALLLRRESLGKVVLRVSG